MGQREGFSFYAERGRDGFQRIVGMLMLALSAAVFVLLVRVFAPIDGDCGFLRAFALAAAVTVAGALLEQIHPVARLLTTVLAAWALRRFCFLPRGAAWAVAGIHFVLSVAGAWFMGPSSSPP